MSKLPRRYPAWLGFWRCSAGCILRNGGKGEGEGPPAGHHPKGRTTQLQPASRLSMPFGHRGGADAAARPPRRHLQSSCAGGDAPCHRYVNLSRLPEVLVRPSGRFIFSSYPLPAPHGAELRDYPPAALCRAANAFPSLPGFRRLRVPWSPVIGSWVMQEHLDARWARPSGSGGHGPKAGIGSYSRCGPPEGSGSSRTES